MDMHASIMVGLAVCLHVVSLASRIIMRMRAEKKFVW